MIDGPGWACQTSP